jgi:hypothetical protein
VAGSYEHGNEPSGSIKGEEFMLLYLFTGPLYVAFYCVENVINLDIRGCIQKFPGGPPGARAAKVRAVCHWVQLQRDVVSQSDEFYRHNPLCCFSTCLLLFISSTQSGNFWIHPRISFKEGGE